MLSKSTCNEGPMDTDGPNRWPPRGLSFRTITPLMPALLAALSCRCNCSSQTPGQIGTCCKMLEGDYSLHYINHYYHHYYCYYYYYHHYYIYIQYGLDSFNNVRPYWGWFPLPTIISGEGGVRSLRKYADNKPV